MGLLKVRNSEGPVGGSQAAGGNVGSLTQAGERR